MNPDDLSSATLVSIPMDISTMQCGTYRAIHLGIQEASQDEEGEQEFVTSGPLKHLLNLQCVGTPSTQWLPQSLNRAQGRGCRISPAVGLLTESSLRTPLPPCFAFVVFQVILDGNFIHGCISSNVDIESRLASVVQVW